jgi:hypothetical protein
MRLGTGARWRRAVTEPAAAHIGLDVMSATGGRETHPGVAVGDLTTPAMVPISSPSSVVSGIWGVAAAVLPDIEVAARGRGE